MPLRHSPVPPLLLVSLLLATAPAALPAQMKPTCDRALQLMLAQVAGAPADTSIYVFTKRQDADNALRRLTFLATDSPGCPAAYGARGLVKQRLAKTDWVPKDAPGQKAGSPWNQGAVYDLAFAAKGGGPAAVAAATLATQALLPDKVKTPWLVKEVGPTLLDIRPAPSEIPDTIRWFQRGRLAAWLWRPESADSAFSAYQAGGGSPDRAALELARIRLAMGSAGADSLYYRAAAASTDRIARDLRYDLAFVADSQELVPSTGATRSASCVAATILGGPGYRVAPPPRVPPAGALPADRGGARQLPPAQLPAPIRAERALGQPRGRVRRPRSDVHPAWPARPDGRGDPRRSLPEYLMAVSPDGGEPDPPLRGPPEPG